MALDGFRSALSFLTRIPAGSFRFSDTYVLYFSAVSLVTGTIGALPMLLSPITGQLAASSLSVALLLIFTGYHHADAVIDCGDALMKTGTVEERRAALKDGRTGTGGIVTFVILYGALLSAFSSTPFPFFAFLLAEMASKSSMVLSALHGRPFGRGMGQSFRESLDRRRAPSVLANTLPQLVLALLFPGPGAYSLLVAVASSIAASLFLHRAFGGFNGDVLGLTGEIGRISFAVSFLILARLHMYPDLCLLHSLLASSRS